MNKIEKEKYYTSLNILDKHIIYTSKQERKYKNSSITLKPGNGSIYFELYFDVGNSTKTKQIYTYSSEVKNSYSKSFTDTAILVACKEDHKSYNLIRQCFKEALDITFPSKQELIECLQRFADNQECQRYWCLPSDLAVDSSKCDNYNKKLKKFKSRITSRVPLFSQNISNAPVNSTSFPFMRINNSSPFALQQNYTAFNQRAPGFNSINDISSHKNEDFRFSLVFLPLLLMGLLIMISCIICKLKRKATPNNKACVEKGEERVALQEVNVKNNFEPTKNDL
ncbi:hypothetical protein [Candidatus Mesenet endosymbiont of Agriotes lineatus]|uniref:hypothetical protein n=1 Tax=Candidatus Mesenet endosymbiont of Agriotes lineatus TaxID=3077948 RepID=UPI0030CF47EF